MATKKKKVNEVVEKSNVENEEIAGETFQPDIMADNEIDPEFLNDFLVETREHLEAIEADIINLEADPGNIDLIHGLFREFHTIKGLAGFVDQNLIRELSHRTETLLDRSRKGKVAVGRGLIDLVLQSSDHIKRICADLSLSRDQKFIASVDLHLAALEGQDSEEYLTESAIAGPEDLPAGQESAPHSREARDPQPGRIADVESGHVRVSNRKVDNLGDLAGELMIIQSQIAQEIISRLGANDPLIASLIRMGKIGNNIQELSMSLRMVSLKSTFLKLSRIGRDTAVETGKSVRLQFIGEETEIDRRVAESILDPLLHLIKNSIYHGIEQEDVRISRGKPAQGRVRIQAYSRRGSVYIDVSDDGQGIPLEWIREKAGEKKLLDPAKTYEEAEILNLIFLPGFSTVKSANSISGRGVGLDVVKTEVSRIGGKVEVRNQPGEGCSFLLKIPINLAAINGTIVDIAGGSYIIPTLHIRQIVNLDSEQWISIAGNKSLIRIKEEIIPVIPVARILGVGGEESTAESNLIVVVELERKLIALPVQGIIDRREVVVKTLGSDFSDLAYVAGASILGDGRVSLILDVESLFGIGEVM